MVAFFFDKTYMSACSRDHVSPVSTSIPQIASMPATQREMTAEDMTADEVRAHNQRVACWVYDDKYVLSSVLNLKLIS